ncbi:MAG TPA: glycosyltransferase family 4 protein, partial [Bacillota bacterium]|nr:glycosyltransferase family 4 protein [Bacillota bacterium]
MRKLLVFTENYARGGGNRYLIDTVNAVADQYNQITLVSNPGGVYPEDLRRLTHDVSLGNLNIITKARIMQIISRMPPLLQHLTGLLASACEPLLFLYNFCLGVILLLREKPTAVLCCNGGYPGARATLSVVIAAGALKIPAALSIVSMPMPRKKVLLAYQTWIDRLVGRAAKAIIVNASSISTALQSLRNFPHNKLHVVYNGIEAATGRSSGGTGEKPSHSPDTQIVGC